ncbi:MAG TPA: hypothetical protein VGC22_02500 [Chitinophaga sp.]
MTPIATHLQQIADTLGVILPAFYRAQLEARQLTESTLLNDLTNLYGTNDLLGRNQDYELPRYLPGYLLIGDNSGGGGIIIRANGTADPAIYLCSLGSLAPEDMALLAHHWEEWAARGYEAETVLEESVAVQTAQQSGKIALRGEHQRLKLALREIEQQRTAGALALKDYLARKKTAQQALEQFEAAHKGQL